MKYEDIDLKKVEAFASRGLTLEQVANSIGISDRTLYNYKNKYSEFAEAIKRGQAKGVAHVTNKLMEQIDNGNTTATIFYLKAKGGWKEATQVEHSGLDGKPIEINSTKDLRGMTDEQLQAILDNGDS